VQHGAGVGTCVGDQGGSYVEAHPGGEPLLLALIEPGPNNAPDYSNVRGLLFVRQISGSGLPTAPASGPPPPGPLGPAGAAALSGDEVSDPSWSFTFRLPTGWKHQKGGQGATLGHDTIPGLILVLPHDAANLQELQGGMQRGFHEEHIGLMLAGRLQAAGTNALAGEYTGVAQGGPVRARGIGVLGP
jgi:hypothetical protein